MWWWGGNDHLGPRAGTLVRRVAERLSGRACLSPGYDLRGSYTSVKTLHFGVSLCLNLYIIQAEMSGRHLGSEGKSGKEVRV